MNRFKTLFLLSILVCSVTAFVQKQSASDINASKLISLTNTVIDISNKYIDQYQYYQNRLDDGVKLHDRYKENFNPSHSVSMNGSASFPIAVGYFNKYDEALKAVPATVKEKAAISNAVKAARATTDKLEKWSARMKTYFEGKEFASDQFAAYPAINDSLEYYLTATRQAWRKAANIASDAGDDAEMQLLKKDPISQFLIPMKTDLKLFDQIIDEFSDQTDQETPDFTELKKQMETLKANVAKNKSTQGKNVSLLSHEDAYTGYYDDLESFLKTLTDLVAELEKDSPSDSKLDLYYNNLKVYRREVINSYNNFASDGAK